MLARWTFVFVQRAPLHFLGLLVRGFRGLQILGLLGLRLLREPCFQLQHTLLRRVPFCFHLFHLDRSFMFKITRTLPTNKKNLEPESWSSKTSRLTSAFFNFRSVPLPIARKQTGEQEGGSQKPKTRRVGTTSAWSSACLKRLEPL